MTDIKCPHCSSADIIKAGSTYRADGKHQLYRCKKCFRVWSDKEIKKEGG